MTRVEEAIKKDVVDQLYWDTRVDASDVQVEVNGGTVVLTGSVPTHAALRAALYDAWSVVGAVDVESRLDVRLPPSVLPPSDEELAGTIASVLHLDPDIGSVDIRVSANDGVVTLAGSVTTYWAKMHAEETAGRCSGVRDVKNLLNVVPTEDAIDKNIADDIVRALERNVLVDADSVTVEVNNGEVTLSGALPSWTARQCALEAAMFTRGVLKINDEMGLRV